MNISISIWISRYLYACRYLCVFIDIYYIHKGQVPRWRDSRDNEIFMQSPGRRYLTMPGKRLRRETTSVKVRFGSTLKCKKKGQCIGRKQESIFESEAWTYISCSRQNTYSVFRRVLYRRERRAATWPGESKFFFIFLLVLPVQSRKRLAEPICKLGRSIMGNNETHYYPL